MPMPSHRPRSAAHRLAAVALVVAAGAGAAEPSLETVVVQPEQALRVRTWDGVVEAVNQATLSAQTGGRVVELPFDVNDYVEAGQVVVRFTDVEQQSGQRRAEADLKAAEANWAEAEAAWKRVADLVERQLVARSQFDEATARRDAARAQLDAARAAVREAGEQVDYTVIRAPYSGIVTERHVEIGETVRPGQPLVSGISLGRLRVNVEIPQGEVAAIRRQAEAAVLLADGSSVRATRVTVFPYADPKTHSFSVRVDLPEAETGLQPGMTVKTVFKLGEAERLLVPVTALVRRSEVTAVYVVGADAGIALRQVRAGHRYGDRIEILAGLEAGERIALDPVAALGAITAQRQAARRD